MAKISKKTKESTALENSPTAPVTDLQNGNGVAKSDKPLPGTISFQKSAKPKSAAKSRSAVARKSSSAGKPRSTAPVRKPSAKKGLISDEEIRIRAYFISENRMREGRQGDSSTDWLEARRQLEREAGKRS